MRTGNCLSCGEDWRTHEYSCKYQIIEPKPTIEELEKIREQEGNHSIDIMPNGQVRRKIHLAEQPLADCDCLGTPKIHTIECVAKPEQPNTNAMIFEQVNGSIKVAVELLEQLATSDTEEESQKHGCIWTLKGWWENNLKHLQRAIK